MMPSVEQGGDNMMTRDLPKLPSQRGVLKRLIIAFVVVMCGMMALFCVILAVAVHALQNSTPHASAPLLAHASITVENKNGADAHGFTWPARLTYVKHATAEGSASVASPPPFNVATPAFRALHQAHGRAARGTSDDVVVDLEPFFPKWFRAARLDINATLVDIALAIGELAAMQDALPRTLRAPPPSQPGS